MPRRRSTSGKGKKKAPRTLASLEKELAVLKERQAVLMAALGLKAKSRKGERGRIGELNESIIKIQDYLLRTSERLDGILATLKNHRELLVQLSQRMYKSGTRDRLRVELDLMRNTLSILALNGVTFDEALWKDIRELRASVEDDSVEVAELRRSKRKLDKRFDGEVGKFDPLTVYRPRDEDIPGYG